MKIVECNRNCSKIVSEILEKTMSWFHSYYAASCIEINVCRAVVAYDRDLVGVGVFYKIPKIEVGVIYYVGVLPGFRGRGIGKAIVSSIEEILSDEGVELFIATTRRDNVASRSMLKDLGYIEVFINELSEEIEEVITMMTCGYDDDILYIKLELKNLDVNDFLKIIMKQDSVNIIERLWRTVCYSPWVRLRRRKV